MNIKSLLLGSAAAMVAVSGAQAADAVVVEAEPVEYVRVCDAYGSGFFFIPGTETCIRFGGFIRTTAGKIDQTVTDAAGATIVSIDENVPATAAPTTPPTTRVLSGEANSFVTRARLNIDTRNETDLGTLRGIFRLEAGDSNDPSATPVRADVALVSLAGFRIGQNGGNYFTSNHGFAGVNLSAVTFTTEGFYGFDDSMVFDYTWAADGLAITVGVENTTGNDLGTGLGTPSDIDYYAGFNYSADFGTVAFTAAHDTDATDPAGDRGGWAYKASLTLDLSEFIPGGTLHGFYMTDDDYNTRYLNQAGQFANVEEAYGVAFQANLTDEVELIGLWNRSEGDDTEGDADIYTVGLNWFPSATPGFSIRAAYSHLEVEDTLAPLNGTARAGELTDLEADAFEITLRRDF